MLNICAFQSLKRMLLLDPGERGDVLTWFSVARMILYQHLELGLFGLLLKLGNAVSGSETQQS